MTRQEYTDGLWNEYSPVSVLSEKNGCRVVRIRNRALMKDIVVRCLPEKGKAYPELCRIKCEELPEVYDVIDVDDGQIVLEEYIDGITVADVIDTGLYKYKGAAEVLRKVCAALSVLHKRGIVHRDIKPENVMVTPDGRVVLIDFNASRIISSAKKDTVVMGTVGYASPEQLGVAQSDARTDVYAAGVLLNVMLTGKHPSEYLAKGKAGRIVKKCTAINPNDRYQSAEKLAEAL